MRVYKIPLLARPLGQARATIGYPVFVYKIPYRRARAWPSGCIGRVRRASKGILHTNLVYNHSEVIPHDNVAPIYGISTLRHAVDTRQSQQDHLLREQNKPTGVLKRYSYDS